MYLYTSVNGPFQSISIYGRWELPDVVQLYPKNLEADTIFQEKCNLQHRLLYDSGVLVGDWHILRHIHLDKSISGEPTFTWCAE